MSSRRDSHPGPDPVPVLKPRLPTADAVLPYLRRIDASRIYTNFGPLAMEFEARLCDRFRLPRAAFATASSGTAALVGALLARADRGDDARPFAAMPAFTFVATAVAAEQCGYRPLLVDIDPRTWMLDPEALLDHPDLARIGVVIPVAPFGKAVPQAPWKAFEARTGIPVVIDGAACFEAIDAAPEEFLGDIPVALSFHATKSFAVGEGGGVACRDEALAQRVVRALNFGFYGSRDSQSASINGKLSELHAAVGLAELDGWEAKRAALHAVARRYRERFAAAGLADRFFGPPLISSSYALFACGSAEESSRAQAALRADAVEFRLWYGGGLQEQTHFATSRHGALAATADLAPRLLGVPMFPDLGADAIARVVGALATACAETA
jgi:dTDP-4-amino-4,6-dideoxygalactose transaminase